MKEEELSRSVRDYYEHNTRRFLLFGGSQEAMTIHRAVWGAGVTTRADALNYTNRLLLEQLQATAQERVSHPGEPLHVLDLGCGVGGSLIYLAQHFNGPVRGSGVTLSPLQARLADEHARRLNLSGRCAFYEASYLNLPPLPQADLAFAIESFVLGPDPARFFSSAAQAIKPGGRLVIIDDFLRDGVDLPHPKHARWVEEFQHGWHAASLITPQEAQSLAAQAGFSHGSARDLTPLLHLRSPRDHFVAFTVAAGRVLPLKTLLGEAYWGSLTGGHALQQCLQKGVIQYRLLVFNKA